MAPGSRTIVATGTLKAAGGSHTGLRRADNQDLFHVDLQRGLFVVIDGVGGQAAGGRAADVALSMLRARLERETGPVEARIREAVTVANNEVYRVAATRPEWHGMACVLTVVIVGDGVATVGHVGDTRLYALREGRIDKVTADHSPVGEREDAGELTELEAMRHPRRNEVYRDVGSEPHEVGDADFVDVQTMAFEPDAALLLCSDGLSDLVTSEAIADLVHRHAGRPEDVVRALIDAANEAGGKDNVTGVYVEGPAFAVAAAEALRRAGVRPAARVSPPRHAARASSAWPIALAAAAMSAGAALMWAFGDGLRSPGVLDASPQAATFVVRPGDSIGAVLDVAPPGSQVVVEPGEYRERLRLRDGVRLVSRVPRGATLRLPAGASETEPAVLAEDLSDGNLTGFLIVGDAATPLGTGFAVRNAVISIVDVEVTGASAAAVDLTGAGTSVVGAAIHDNPGAGLIVRAGATPRIASSAFLQNGAPEGAVPALVLEAGARPTFAGNVFRGVGPEAFRSLSTEAREGLVRENWFAGLHEPAQAATPSRTDPRRATPTAPASGTAERGGGARRARP